MKMQHRINTTMPNTWLRPVTAIIQDGNLLCDFEPGKHYELQSSYDRSPHAQFLNATSDERMRAFVKAWGPLYLRTDQAGATLLTFPLAEYHAIRKRFAALRGLVDAIDAPRLERERLREFFEAVEEYDSQLSAPLVGVEADELQWFRQRFEVRGSMTDWVLEASPDEVRSAVQWIVPMNLAAPRASVSVVRKAGRRVLQAHWALDTLRDALHWMLWYDVFRRDPLICCQECRTFFKGGSKHDRKFCDNGLCARRVAARKWRKKDLADKRAAKQAEKNKEKRNGTHKTR
jgi:hypothetical protein